MTPQPPSPTDAISALQGTLERLGHNYKLANQIVEASEAVIRTGKLPTGLSRDEVEELEASLAALRTSAQNLRRLGERIEAALPQVEQSIAKQKAQIENDYTHFTTSLEQQKQSELTKINEQEAATSAALAELEKTYKAQKAELKNKLKALAEAKKTADKTFVEKKKTAQNALGKAIGEAQTAPPAFDAALITEAQQAETKLVTELNKTKGHLQAAFAAPQDAETLKAILG